MTKLVLLAGASMFVLAGAASASQPLSDNQMDRVVAGATALSAALALAAGDFDAQTTTHTTAVANTTMPQHFAHAGAASTGLASSALTISATAGESAAAAALP